MACKTISMSRAMRVLRENAGMERFETNTMVLRVSRTYLVLWILALVLFVALMVMRSPYRYYPLLGVTFLYLWILTAGLYPRSVGFEDDRLSLEMTGFGNIRELRMADLQVRKMDGYYELSSRRKGERNRYMISMRSIPPDLEKRLRKMR